MNHSITTWFTSLIFLALTASTAVAQTINYHLECRSTSKSCMQFKIPDELKDKIEQREFESEPLIKIGRDDVESAMIFDGKTQSEMGGTLTYKAEVQEKLDKVRGEVEELAFVALVVDGEVVQTSSVAAYLAAPTYLFFERRARLPERVPWINQVQSTSTSAITKIYKYVGLIFFGVWFGAVVLYVLVFKVIKPKI